MCINKSVNNNKENNMNEKYKGVKMTSRKAKMFEPRSFYKPFSFPAAFLKYQQQNQIHWIPSEVPLGDDVFDWHHKLTIEEKHLLTQLFRFFTQADVDVSEAYTFKYLNAFGHVPELRMMLLAFANMESVHQEAYSLLLETVGMDEIEYQAFTKYEAMKNKHDFLGNFSVDDPFETARSMAVISGGIEGVQLFSSFIIMLNFTRHNLMKGMGQIIAWSVRDEAVSADTEVLLSTGEWKQIETLELFDKILQYDMDTGKCSFEHPTKKQHVVRDKTFIFDGPGFKQRTSAGHRMISRQDGDIKEETASNTDLSIDAEFILSSRKIGSMKIMSPEQIELCEHSKNGDIDLSWIIPIMSELDAEWIDEFFIRFFNQ